MREDFAQYVSFVDACLRAIESARDDHLILDPFAEPLTRQIAPKLVPRFKAETYRPEDFMALRSRYLDEAILHRNPNIQQVVILGAGLDTRAFRLGSLRGCHVFEIDQSVQLFAHKSAVLNELDPELIAERHNCIVANLNDFNWEENLLSSRFNPDIPTFWAMEGLTMYLTRASNLALLKTIDILSAPGSEIWADMVGEALVTGNELGLFTELSQLCESEVGETLFIYGENDVLEGVFSELSWEMEVKAALANQGTHFGREWVPMRSRWDNTPVAFTFVLAKKPLQICRNQISLIQMQRSIIIYH
ncbi:hypothetical protein DD238_004273 [Peronospora effusa]|uniref:S-adenosyl-L-methionine-dependent methyltransferase n=1 Tax=Peronospora effusa TaxID=542832 RepID=A0A3M6VPJ3_9STRA|nr:hypothetical protein DD238_004273 [Peronospora effusa]